MEWCLLIVVDCLNEVVKLSEAKQCEMEIQLIELEWSCCAERAGPPAITNSFHKAKGANPFINSISLNWFLSLASFLCFICWLAGAPLLLMNQRKFVCFLFIAEHWRDPAINPQFKKNKLSFHHSQHAPSSFIHKLIPLISSFCLRAGRPRPSTLFISINFPIRKRKLKKWRSWMASRYVRLLVSRHFIH